MTDEQNAQLFAALEEILRTDLFSNEDGLRTRGRLLRFLVRRAVEKPDADFRPKRIATEFYQSEVAEKRRSLGTFRTLLHDLRTSLAKYYKQHQPSIGIRIPLEIVKPAFSWNDPPTAVASTLALDSRIVDFFSARQVPVGGIDQYVELGHAPDGFGWKRADIELKNIGVYTIPRALEEMIEKVPLPPGRQEAVNYGLFDYSPIVADKGERLLLEAKVARYGIEYSFLQGGSDIDGVRRPYRSQCERLFQIRKSPLFHGMVSHIAVLTTENDGTEELLLCRRSPFVDFFPAHWSASIEEHLMFKHFDPTIPIADEHPFDAVRRGLESELAVSTSDNDIVLLTFGIEWSVWNAAFCFVAKIRCGYEEIAWRWANADDRDEATVLDCTPATQSNLTNLLMTSVWQASSRAMYRDEHTRAMEERKRSAGETRGTPLHPTSRPRIQALRRFLNSRAGNGR